MNTEQRTKFGLTLIEMMVVIATITMLVFLGMPAVRAFFNSFETQSGAKTMISAALTSARAIAIKERRYAGIRFQKAHDPGDPAYLDAVQYMIYIVHEERRKIGNITNGFRAVDGLKPVKLPDSVGVMDFQYDPGLFPSGDGIIDSDAEISSLNESVIRDTTTFSIIFSPSGKLVVHPVRVRNRDGRTEGTEDSELSRDAIFNTLTKITNSSNPVGMFVQDDYPALGFSEENSRTSFIVYEKIKFKQAYKAGTAWSGYLARLVPETIYINSYTGTVISPDS